MQKLTIKVWANAMGYIEKPLFHHCLAAETSLVVLWQMNEG